MDIQLSVIIFQIINFGVVLVALWFLLYKPVLKIFEERAKRVEEGQKAAAKALAHQEKIEQLKAKTELELKEQSASILKKATQEAKEQQAEILAKAKAEAEQLIEKMRADYQAEWQASVRNQEQALISHMYEAVANVLPKTLTKADQKELLSQELAVILKKL